MIPDESLPHFENALYLPMLIIILEKDLYIIEDTQLKFKRSYAKMINQTLNNARSDLKRSNIYLMRNNMKLIKFNVVENHTEFVFSADGYDERRKYLNADLKVGTEEIMIRYLSKFEM